MSATTIVAAQAQTIEILRAALSFIVDGAEMGLSLPVAVVAVARGALSETEPDR